MIEIPERVRRTALHADGGPQWLASLPAVVASLCDDWELMPVSALAGGSAALVVLVSRTGGDHAILKIAPDAHFASQVRTLVAAGGRGYVRLLASDLHRNAALLERLGEPLSVAGASVEQVLDISATTLIDAWAAARPVGAEVTPGADKASQLIGLLESLWPQLGRPCPAELVDRARECALARLAAFDLAECVVVHGDPHPANLLAVSSPRIGGRSGYVFVDPEGFLAEPAYDLGVVVRAWTDEVIGADDPVALIRGYCARLSTATGVDEQAIWEWAFVERVTSGLYLMRYGHHNEAMAFLTSAARL